MGSAQRALAAEDRFSAAIRRARRIGRELYATAAYTRDPSRVRAPFTCTIRGLAQTRTILVHILGSLGPPFRSSSATIGASSDPRIAEAEKRTEARDRLCQGRRPATTSRASKTPAKITGRGSTRETA